MINTLRNRFFGSCSVNLKPVVSNVEPSKTCPFDKLRAGSELSRRIQSLKWLGLSVIAFVLVACVAVAEAQQQKVARIGVLVPGEAWYEIIDGLRGGLKQLGLAGKTVRPRDPGLERRR